MISSEVARVGKTINCAAEVFRLAYLVGASLQSLTTAINKSNHVIVTPLVLYGPDPPTHSDIDARRGGRGGRGQCSVKQR